MTDQTTRRAVDPEAFDELVAVTRHFAEAVPRRLAPALDTADPGAIAACWSGVCEIGLERCLAPERWGGIDLPADALPALLEELAAGDAGVALAVLLSNAALLGLAGAPGLTVRDDERCVLVPGGDVRETAPARLSGEVPLAYDAAAADLLLVCAGDRLFAVDPEDRGLRPVGLGGQLGLGATPALALTLREVRGVSCGDAEAVTTLLHAGVAAIARGVARRAETMARAYAEQRRQGGGPIIVHGAVRDMLARMAERRLGGTVPGAPRLAAALAARIGATDAAVVTTTDAVQVFGGMGYMVETGVEKLMRDAKACQLYPMSNWLAREWLLELER